MGDDVGFSDEGVVAVADAPLHGVFCFLWVVALLCGVVYCLLGWFPEHGADFGVCLCGVAEFLPGGEVSECGCGVVEDVCEGVVGVPVAYGGDFFADGAA